MKNVIILGVSLCLGLSGMAYAAQAARQGTTAPIVAEAERHVAATQPEPGAMAFRNGGVHGMEGAAGGWGEMAARGAPAGSVYMKFGYVQGQDDPVVFSGRDVPQKVSFNEVNSWLNDSIKLEDLEEMGCVPKGTYHSYNERLNRVMSQRKQFGVN